MMNVATRAIHRRVRHIRSNSRCEREVAGKLLAAVRACGHAPSVAETGRSRVAGRRHDNGRTSVPPAGTENTMSCIPGCTAVRRRHPEEMLLGEPRLESLSGSRGVVLAMDEVPW